MEPVMLAVALVAAVVALFFLSPRAEIVIGVVLGAVGVGAIVVGGSLFRGQPTHGDYFYRDVIVGLITVGGMLVGLVGALLVIVGMRRTRTTAPPEVPSAGGGADRRASERLGRYVDGRWTCFAHERRWCRVCSARLQTQELSLDADAQQRQSSFTVENDN